MITLRPLFKKALAVIPRSTAPEIPSYAIALRRDRRFSPPALTVNVSSTEILRQTRKPAFMPLRPVAIAA